MVYSLEQQILDTDIFLSNMAKEYWLYNLFFQCVFLSGLRFQELKESERFILTGDTSGTWVTLKNNFDRFFYEDFFPALFYTQHSNDIYFFNPVSHSTACNYFLRFHPQPHIFVDNKSLKIHFFRHLKMKMMYNDGFSISEIQEFFGEKDVKNVQGYVFSLLKVPD